MCGFACVYEDDIRSTKNDISIYGCRGDSPCTRYISSVGTIFQIATTVTEIPRSSVGTIFQIATTATEIPLEFHRNGISDSNDPILFWFVKYILLVIIYLVSGQHCLIFADKSMPQMMFFLMRNIFSHSFQTAL